MHKAQCPVNSVSLRTSGNYIYQLLSMMGFMVLLLVSNSVFAAAPSCPSGHSMYYVGPNAPTGASTPTNLGWADGTKEKTFNFSDGTQFKLAFTEIKNLRSSYPSPKFESYSNVTRSAFNMFHSSQKAAINHKLTGTIINSPVSKYGFVVQDLDSSQGGEYIESLSLATSGGSFANLRNGYFQLSNGNQTVSGTKWNNCSTSNACDFNVNWSPAPGNTSFAANIPFTVSHGNAYTGTSTSASDHLMGYSDFYFCVAPSDYTFSGTVFNDNGGLNNSPKDESFASSFINEPNYFNGVFDEGESGIDGSAFDDLKVRLTDCNDTDITGTTPQNVSDNGGYSFTVPSSALAGKDKVCLVQTEPSTWDYTVDTTSDKREVALIANEHNYESLDFGEVIAEQTALVLKKYQYVHQCDANLDYNATAINGSNISTPTDGFSIYPASDVDPGQCIAYKIEAYNHGHIPLTDIRITDVLQKTPIESVFHLPVSSGITASLRATDKPNSGLVKIGDNGVIITELFDLNNTATTTTVSKEILYFNTKYGTSMDGQ